MESTMKTRDKIMIESLKLFSSRGYDGVSMREIAAAVGIKGASIYNHFKGKEDIFNAIFEEMTKRYENAAAIIKIPTEQEATVYLNADESQLIQMAEGLFAFFTEDEFAVLFRKLLISEQHKSPLAAQCLKKYYLEAPIQFQGRIFEEMQNYGAFQNYDTSVMALHFYSPIYYILNKFDLGSPFKDCMEELKKHIHWFCSLYH